MSDHPTPVLKLINEQPRTLSTDVAAYFGKQHQHVMRQIRNLLNDCPEEWGRSNFGLTSYADEQGRPQPCYSMTKDGFMLLAMGFTGPKAMRIKIAYIEAFNAMEAELAAPKALPAPEPAPKVKKRGRKRLPAPTLDPTERQLDELLGKVRFYIREVSVVEKQVADILLAERNKNRHGQFSTDYPPDRVYLNLSCSHRTLWSTLDFGLQAVECSVQTMLSASRL